MCKLDRLVESCVSSNLIIYGRLCIIIEQMSGRKLWELMYEKIIDFTAFSSPIVDGLWRSFYHAVQSDVGAERSTDQLIVYLNDWVDC